MILSLAGVLVAALRGAVDAPVTQVTVFATQARVVRTAQLTVNGAQSVELPALRDTVDQASVRVEATGAEVRRVDIERLEPEKLRTDEAKALLAELEKVDTELRRLSGERGALSEQKAALERLVPQAPEGDVLHPAPKLAAGGWSTSTQFSSDQVAKAQQRIRDGELQSKKLQEKRAQLAQKAWELGQPQTTSGWKVVAQLAGNGPATVTVSYLVNRAHWTPAWDLQLLPDSNTVNLSLAGLVSQDSGEDWSNAALTLSTAIPSSAVKAPRLTTWKIGIVDRFIPTPTPVTEQIAPPPSAPTARSVNSDEDLLRSQLQAVAGHAPVGRPQAQPVAPQQFYESQRSEDFRSRKQAKRRDMAPPPPPSPAPMGARGGAQRPSAVSRAEEPSAPAEESAVEMAGATVFGELKEAAAPASAMSLAPPPAWTPPSFGADSPVTLAGGYDLAFTSLQKETVPTAKGTRRVALWSQKWPVQVERKLFPALAPEAYLVAELKNPSKDVLPGGPAQLYVGADPAGTARLKLVSPGEAFSLPLGLDRALKAVRNVQVVDSTQGLISKDDLTTYVVTIEIANPYRTPVAVRVYDQWPLSNQKELEVKLIESKPLAIQDAPTGALEWRLTIPAQRKTSLSFSYSLKRPRGWKLNQSEVQP